MSFINGGGSQMPMMISSSGSLCMLAVAGAGIFWYVSSNKGDQNDSSAGRDSDVDMKVDEPSPPAAALSATTYRVHSGSLGMDADCSRPQVQMKDAQEDNTQQWKVVPVNGKADVYNLLSNQRSISGCPAYLTADSSCNGTSLESPQYLDRQEFEVLGGSGQPKQIRSVACKNKNLPSYVNGNGRDAGLKFQRKSGTSFSFDPIA